MFTKQTKTAVAMIPILEIFSQSTDTFLNCSKTFHNVICVVCNFFVMNFTKKTMRNNFAR